MNHPTPLGSYDDGVLKCDCGSMLFVEVTRTLENGCTAVSIGTRWRSCAHCRQIWAFDRSHHPTWYGIAKP